MMKFTDELHKLNRDLTGLGGLLYDMSNSVGCGGEINEGELMLLAEIAYRGAEIVKSVVSNHESNNTSAENFTVLTAPVTAEVELPVYLMHMAELRGANFSEILQRGFKEFCGITD